jgi:hypothetical protein
MRRCFGHAPCSLSALRTWIMRETGVDLLGRLSIAFSHCMCTGRWGAIWCCLIFPASFRIPSNCCLDPYVVAMGLPSGSHIHSAYLFGWVSKCDRACLDRTRQQERGVCIYHGRHLQRERSSSISSSSSSPQEHSTGDL